MKAPNRDLIRTLVVLNSFFRLIRMPTEHKGLQRTRLVQVEGYELNELNELRMPPPLGGSHAGG